MSTVTDSDSNNIPLVNAEDMTERTLAYVLGIDSSDKGGIQAADGVGAVAKQAVSTEFAYQFGDEFSSIDSIVYGSWVFDGTSSFPNKLGVNNTKPSTEPGWGTRDADDGYVAGAALVAAIIGGYDNVNNSQAGMIAAQHSMIYSLSDHSSIWGGSKHTIESGAMFATIQGGTNNRIQGNGLYGGIFNSDSCSLLDGSTQDKSGFRATIIGSQSSSIKARNSFVSGGTNVTVGESASYASVFGVATGTLTNGAHMGAGGANVSMGGTTASDYSFSWGEGITVNADRTFSVGDGHTVSYSYVVATGGNTIAPFAGAKVHSSRQRGGTAGNNQSLEWVASNETTDTTTTRLSTYGSASYPTQPQNSVVTGTCWITGVSDAGVSSAFKIDFVSTRGTDTPTIVQTKTVINDGLSLPTDPTMNATTGGIYRVQVVGLASTNIRWTANFIGNQTVYG